MYLQTALMHRSMRMSQSSTRFHWRSSSGTLASARLADGRQPQAIRVSSSSTPNDRSRHKADIAHWLWGGEWREECFRDPQEYRTENGHYKSVRQMPLRRPRGKRSLRFCVA